MMALRLLVLLLGTLAWTGGAPHHQEYEHFDKLAAFSLGSDEAEDYQQNQEHEDTLGNLQQQYQSEDLQQFQQNPFLEEHLPIHLEDYSQHAQRLEQNHVNDDYVQQSQPINLERFPEPHGQLREPIPHEDDTQQFQPVEFNQYQQGPLPVVPQSGRLEVGHDDFHLPQGHETHLRGYEQQSQSEDLSQYTQQHDQVGRLTDETQQIQDHDSFIDDTQQHSQVEDLTQFQQGRLTDEQQSGRLEDLGHDAGLLQQTQEKQIADLMDYPEQIGQIRVQDDDTQQTQDHDSFTDDSHQQSHVEDLTQFQQGRLTNEQQSGRLESLGHDADMLQQTQEKQIADLTDYPEQIGQIRVEEDDTQQIQDHDSFIDDSHQQSQVEDLTQFQQGSIGQQIGRLEDLGEHTETQQQNIEKLIEDYDHDGGQQQTQNEDLSAFSIGQFRAAPNVPPLEVSQVRHEQNEFSFNAPKVESEDIGRSYNQEENYKTEEIHQQAPVHPLNSELSGFNLEEHVPTKKPGFWKRLGSKIESAYEEAKEKSKHAIHRIKENLG